MSVWTLKGGVGTYEGSYPKNEAWLQQYLGCEEEDLGSASAVQVLVMPRGWGAGRAGTGRCEQPEGDCSEEEMAEQKNVPGSLGTRSILETCSWPRCRTAGYRESRHLQVISEVRLCDFIGALLGSLLEWVRFIRPPRGWLKAQLATAVGATHTDGPSWQRGGHYVRPEGPRSCLTPV